MTTDDVAGALASIAARIETRERELARELGELARALIEADAIGTAASVTLDALREQRDRVAAAHRTAERERERLQASAPTVATEYLLGRAREQEQLWADRLSRCEADVSAAGSRHVEARLRARALHPAFDAARTRTDAELSALLSERAELLMARPDARPHGIAMATARSSVSAMPAPPTDEELRAVRAAIKRDEWADLPVFYGSSQPNQRECLHCSAPLSPERRRFCSRECHEMHLHAYGSGAAPKRGLRR